MTAKLIPQIYATEPNFEKTSSKYQMISTREVIADLESHGYRVADAKARKLDEHSKHMVRFRSDRAEMRGTDEATMEIAIINSHDGTSAFRVVMGAHVFACANGLVYARGPAVADLRITHQGGEDLKTRVREAFDQMVANAGKFSGAMRDMTKHQLSREGILEFNLKALELRWPNGSLARARLEQHPTSLERPRRVEDTGTALWNVFQRTQEHLVRGGLKYVSAKQTQVLKVKALNNIEQNVKFNADLWDLAYGYLQ